MNQNFKIHFLFTYFKLIVPQNTDNNLFLTQQVNLKSVTAYRNCITRTYWFLHETTFHNGLGLSESKFFFLNHIGLLVRDGRDHFCSFVEVVYFERYKQGFDDTYRHSVKLKLKISNYFKEHIYRLLLNLLTDFSYVSAGEYDYIRIYKGRVSGSLMDKSAFMFATNFYYD